MGSRNREQLICKTILAILMLVVFTCSACTQQRPGPPKGNDKSRSKSAPEHPEHPKGGKKSALNPSRIYSIDELEKAITSEIAIAQKENGGWYQFADKQIGKTWSMKLDHVHRERLARLDPKTYFACTDFRSADGHVIDVDFFMKDDGGRLAMSDATVHKVDGKPRYNWKQTNDFWVRVPASS